MLQIKEILIISVAEKKKIITADFPVALWKIIFNFHDTRKKMKFKNIN